MAHCVSVGASQVEGIHVVQEENNVLTDEMIEMITDIGTRYSNLTTAEEVGICDIEEQLNELQKKMLRWDADKSLIWDRVPPQASEYLQDVKEVRELSEVLELLHLSNKDVKHNELMIFSQNILQMAMARLEDEFVQLLIRCCQPVEPDMSFHSAEDESIGNFSSNSFDVETIEGVSHGGAIRESEEDVVINSIHHDLISDIISIANLMFQSKYDKECCHAYVIVRKDALEECLSVLQLEKFSIEEVFNMEWNALSPMIKKWNQAMHVFIRACLARERLLCDLVFGEHSRTLKESCFVEISKSSVLQLLGIAMGIAIAPPKPEKLFRVLDTYEALNDLLVDMAHFFPEDFGSSILTECHGALLRLQESVRGTIEEFKYDIQTNMSSSALAGGGVHPLTKYVMNYITALSAYSKTLALILEDQHGMDQSSSSEDGGTLGLNRSPPLAWHLKSLTAILEANLVTKSQLYNDGSLQEIFIMNNVCYMVDKVRHSDLRDFFGDEWIRTHIAKFRMHALNYQRASWNSVLYFLKEQGIHKAGSIYPSLQVLKDRFRGFNSAFEQVYRAQTGWLVPKEGLREDLRIAVSAQLIQAYRTFEGKYAGYLDGERHRERYIKYSPDDLEEYILDLFGGSSKSLQQQRR